MTDARGVRVTHRNGDVWVSVGRSLVKVTPLRAVGLANELLEAAKAANSPVPQQVPGQLAIDDEADR